jgi:peptidoglycan/LPS O-acetylase OafA/YrhL
MKLSPVLSQFYRPEIDGLRALAIMAVLVNHFDKNILPLGYLGVDIFFVISGYVITSSLHRYNSESIFQFLVTFYGNRIKRLVPALAICIVVSSTAICFFNPNPEASLKTGIWALLGFSNIQMYRSSADYFSADSSLNVNTQTWSLGVEEQFYFIFPLLFWLLYLVRPTPKKWTLFIYFMGAATVGSYIAFSVLLEINSNAAFFLMPSRFWELGVGSISYLVSQKKNIQRLSLYIPPSLVITLVLIVLYAVPTHHLPNNLIVVLLTGILIVTLSPKSIAYPVLCSRPFLYIGAISYSLYLWHWSVISISKWTVGITWDTVLFQVPLIFILSTLSYKYVESPFRKAAWPATKVMTIVYGVVTLTGCCLILFTLLNSFKINLYLGSSVDSTYNTESKQLSVYPEVIGKASAIADTCNISPHRLTGDGYKPKPVIDEAFIKRCVESDDKKILLIGDSFAQVTSPFISLIAQKLGYQFRTIFGYGCPLPFQRQEINTAINSGCREVSEDLIEETILNSIHKGDLLIIRLHLEKSEYLDYQGRQGPSVTAYDQPLTRLNRALNERGAKLLLIGSNPSFTSEQLLSLRSIWFARVKNNDGVSRPSDSRESAYYHELDRHLRTQHAGYYYFSLKSYLCDLSDKCLLISDDRPRSIDGSHLTLSAHDLFFESLLAQVSAAISGAVK